MYNEDSDKNKEIPICILSKCPKNNLQQHLKGQASKYHPPPLPKQHLFGFWAEYLTASSALLPRQPQQNLFLVGPAVVFFFDFFFPPPFWQDDACFWQRWS